MFTLCIFSRTIFYNIAQCFPERKFVKICIIGGIPPYILYFFHTQNSLTLYSTISPITQLVRRSLGLGECRNRFELVPKHIPLPPPHPTHHHFPPPFFLIPLSFFPSYSVIFVFTFVWLKRMVKPSQFLSAPGQKISEPNSAPTSAPSVKKLIGSLNLCLRI